MDTLTSEGATILLGVLLADMTGTMLQLEGVSGGGGSNYYPAAFVNDVIRWAGQTATRGGRDGVGGVLGCCWCGNRDVCVCWSRVVWCWLRLRE